MLAPQDADLARRDPDLPGLSVLLDPDFIVRTLRPFRPDADVEAAKITYVKYKPRTNCLVGYRIKLAAEEVDVYAKAYTIDSSERLRKARERTSVPGPFGPACIIVEDRAIVISIFPNDSKLKRLGELVDPDQRRGLFSKLLPGRPEIWDSGLRSLQYKPERRLVAQLISKDTVQCAVKAYTEAGFSKPLASARAFESRGPLRLARLLGSLDRHHTLIFEWLPGRVLTDALSEPTFNMQRVALVGAALAELHAQAPDGIQDLTRAAEAAVLLTVSEGLYFTCPRLANRIQELTERLCASLLDRPQAHRPIHGDFYSQQVLLRDDGVAIIDLDGATHGDSAADLGNFIARLHNDALQGILPPERAERVKEALLEGYRAATRRSLLECVDLYTAIGLLRVAPHPFRQREPNWLDRTDAIIERAEAIFSKVRTPTSRCVASHISSIPVVDPFGVDHDSKMHFLSNALDGREVLRQIENCCHQLAGRKRQIHLRAIRVMRYKPQRRCLIEYDVEVDRPSAPRHTLTLVGKVRANGADLATYSLLAALRNAGFGDDSLDDVSVPQTVGIIPDLNMWLQKKIPGSPATDLLAAADGVALAVRVAEAIHKVHQAGVPAARRHTMADELRVLHDRLSLVAEMRPAWSARLARILNACDRLGRSVPEPAVCGIHRDFYPDHVQVDGPRLWLLDFDLYCQGDPALDIGNFQGHLIEQSLRCCGRSDALADREAALEERFVQLAGVAAGVSARVYTTLTLVRHIYLSTQFPERRGLTEALVEICEERLGAAQRASVGCQRQ